MVVEEQCGAAVMNMRGDYLAANALGRALYAPLFDSGEQPPNSTWFTFLSTVENTLDTLDGVHVVKGPVARTSRGRGCPYAR